MTVNDLRDSNKVTTKTVNAKENAGLSNNTQSNKHMPCKKSLPT